MGIENRDYYRASGSYSGSWGLDGIAPVCKYLVIANVAVFLLQIFYTREPRPEDLKEYFGEGTEWAEEISEDQQQMLAWARVSVVEEWLALETDKVLHGQIWRLLSYAFCHDRLGVWHILFNMLFLYWFGKTLEAMYGSREFLLFYLASAVAASLCHIGLDLATRHSTAAIGASGAVMGVVMLYAIHYPRERIYVFMIIPIEIRWLVALYVIFDLHPVLLALAGTPEYSGVAHAAHLGGLAFGFVYWRYGLRLEDHWNGMRRLRMPRWFGPRRNIRLYRPPETPPQTDLESLVDKILQKIHDQGEASLTDVERDVLRLASEKYKARARDSGGTT